MKKPINARLKKRTLIDLGSGDKNPTVPLSRPPRLAQLYFREKAKKKSEWKLIGIDPWLSAFKDRHLQVIQGKGLASLRARKSNSIDIINSDYFLGSIYFENEKEKELPAWFRQINRVLKPNGRLYLTVEKYLAPTVMHELLKAGFNAKAIELKWPGTPEERKGKTFSETALYVLSLPAAFGEEKSHPVRIIARKQMQ
ncbi:hypothetical protein HZB89_02105 [archaeon]|nr:hypothetical protein [archaeon]